MDLSEFLANLSKSSLISQLLVDLSKFFGGFSQFLLDLSKFWWIKVSFLGRFKSHLADFSVFGYVMFGGFNLVFDGFK